MLLYYTRMTLHSIDNIKLKKLSYNLEITFLKEKKMAWIDTINEESAAEDLGEQYTKLKNPDGRVDNILKIHSLNPPSLSAHYSFYKTIMFGKSPLSRIDREMIAVVVSAENKCHY